jgi:hypothetical protein
MILSIKEFLIYVLPMGEYMKNISILLICILVGIFLCGCPANSEEGKETTVENTYENIADETLPNRVDVYEEENCITDDHQTETTIEAKENDIAEDVPSTTTTETEFSQNETSPTSGSEGSGFVPGDNELEGDPL